MNSTYLQLLFASGIAVHGAIHLVLTLRKRATISVLDLTLWMTASVFGLGPWAAYFYGQGTLPSEEITTLVSAYACVWLFLPGLQCSKWLTRLFPGRRSPSQPGSVSTLYQALRTSESLPSTIVTPIYLVVWAVRLLIGNEYGVFVSGTATADNLSDLPYGLFVAQSILEIVVVACLVWSNGVLWCGRRRSPSALFIFVAELGWSFLQGRRWLFAFLVVALIGFAAGGRRVRWYMAAAGSLVAIGLVLWVSPAFVNFRDNYLNVYSSSEALSSIWRAVELTLDDGLHGETQSDYREIMQERPLIIGFNLRIAERQEQYGVMWGQALLNSLFWSIPAVLNPGKHTLVKSEEFVQEFYALPYEDTSSNWAAYGGADFGIAGGFLIGLLIGAIISFVERLAAQELTRLKFLALCLLGGMLKVATSFEADPVLLWGTLRTLLILQILLSGFNLIRPKSGSAPTGLPSPGAQLHGATP